MSKSLNIGSVQARAFKIPTDFPEADGTLEWDSTTMVVVEVEAGGRHGLGYSYTDASAAMLVNDLLANLVEGRDAMDVRASWDAMQRAVRNLGRAGLAATAISAVDVALWDLKSKLLEIPLVSLLGRCRETVPIYGSGGFTNYDDARLADQLRGWVERDGCRWVKMKIGTHPENDPERVAAAKAAIGSAELFVDANGAYGVKQALQLAHLFAERDVRWFEEPVSSDDLDGLRRVRDHVRSPMEVAAGEYGYTIDYFRRMLGSGAVDVQQADATRCGGFTGFMRVATLCEAFHTDLSAHCAPALHLHPGCAVPRLRHLEWFHDHVRVENLFFDGAPIPRDGVVTPDMSRPGLGLTLKREDVECFAVTP